MNTRGVTIPFTAMGKVTSQDLFEDREQTLFDFYERNRDRYSEVLDIGANLGVHTILMAKQGWRVHAYEPDPSHYAKLAENLQANADLMAEWPTAIPLAVSTVDGVAEFVLVQQNGTANHLAGAREFHGPVERVQVRTIDCRHLFRWADFAKIDCEGMEAALLCAVTDEPCEFLVEVGTEANASAIFLHFDGKRDMWRQDGNAWRPVYGLEDMPTHYTHGALFIGEHP